MSSATRWDPPTVSTSADTKGGGAPQGRSPRRRLSTSEAPGPRRPLSRTRGLRGSRALWAQQLGSGRQVLLSVSAEKSLEVCPGGVTRDGCLPCTTARVLPGPKPSEASVTGRAAPRPSKSMSLKVAGQGSSPPSRQHCAPREAGVTSKRWCMDVSKCRNQQAVRKVNPLELDLRLGGVTQCGRLCWAPGPTLCCFSPRSPEEPSPPSPTGQPGGSCGRGCWRRARRPSPRAVPHLATGLLGPRTGPTEMRVCRVTSNRILIPKLTQNRGCRKQGGGDADAQRPAACCSQRLPASRPAAPGPGRPSRREVLSTVQPRRGQRRRHGRRAGWMKGGGSQRPG